MNRYDVLLCDPPWWYSNRSANRITKFGGGARSHYPVMRDRELLAMAEQVKAWSADNCALFLWATCPRLDFASELIKAWGFRYATVAFTWIKLNRAGRPWRGCGSYTAANTELVLLGVKGSMPPEKRLVPQVVMSNRMEHSRKPGAVIERIELMYPTARKLEMFARYPQPGWDAWGLEAGAGTAPLFATAGEISLDKVGAARWDVYVETQVGYDEL